MICHDCAIGATYNQAGKIAHAKTFHKKCKGDCGCQHKTGPGWAVKRNEKAPLMQVQSP